MRKNTPDKKPVEQEQERVPDSATKKYKFQKRQEFSKRRQGRHLALEALFLMDSRDQEEDGAMEYIRYRAPELSDEVRFFGEKIAKGVILHLEELDAEIAKRLDNWIISRLALVDRNILRIATYEIAKCEDIPPKVSINEAIEMAKYFGDEKSATFVNGVLDSFIREKKAEEAEAAEAAKE